MRTTGRVGSLLSAAALVALVVGVAPVAADQTPPPASQEKAKPAPAPIVGELVEVDTKARTITVSSAGKELEFGYTDATVVSGAQGGVAGLATMTKSQVTVHFTQEGQMRTATRIEVKAKQ